MEVLPIDVTALAGVIFGTSIVIIPLLGLTLRFAIKPVLESYARAFPNPARQQLELERLERRVRELEDALSTQPSDARQLAAGEPVVGRVLSAVEP